MDMGSFAWGVLLGIGVGVILFTASGREVGGTVARAGAGVIGSTGQRLQREISK
jgi:hypothetical protein